MKNHWLDKKLDTVFLKEDGVDENEMATVREILLKHKNDKTWLSEILGYFINAPQTFGNSTMSGDYFIGTDITWNVCDGPLPIIVDQNISSCSAWHCFGCGAGGMEGNFCERCGAGEKDYLIGGGNIQ